MTYPELEKEIKALDDRFSLKPNENRPGLANIYFNGQNYDLPVVSMNRITEEIDQSNRYEFPNGMSVRHHTKSEIMDRLKDFLKSFNSGSLTEIYG